MNKNPLKVKGYESESQEVLRIVASSSQKNLSEALMSDAVDIVPVVGDVSNAIKVYDSAKKGESKQLILHTGDFILGIIPIIGDFADLLTPTNTLIYVMRKKKLNKALARTLDKPKFKWNPFKG